MKNLQPNLDATTNIEVPLQSSTRILGLDASNNVIEISSSPVDTDGDGSGGMGGGDITDMGGGGSGTGADTLIGNEFCFTLGDNTQGDPGIPQPSSSVFITDINPCYEVGNVLQVSDNSTAPASTITAEITNITDAVLPGMTVTRTDTTPADSNGFTPGSNEWYKPFRDHYIWEVVSETAVNDPSGMTGWGFIDYAWEFPNGAGQFWFPNNRTLMSGYVPNDGSDISGITAGTLLYGRFGGNISSEAAMWNAIEVGTTATLNHHGSLTLRKVGILTERPDPQLWVSTGGFSCYCIYPPFSSNFSSSGFFYGNTGSIRTTSAGTHTSIGQWFPTVKADGTLNNVMSALGGTFTNVNSLGNGAQIITNHGNPTQHGPFGQRFTGGTFTHDGSTPTATTSPWVNDNAGSATTVFNTAATNYLGDTISDPNRMYFFGGVPTSGDYIPPGADAVLGSFNPAGGPGPSSTTMTASTSQVTICAEITAVDSNADENFPVAANTYEFNPLCEMAGDDGSDPDSTDDGDGGLDTRTCVSKKIGRTDGILLYTSGTTELAAGVDLSTNPALETINLDLTGLGEELATLTTSTTLEDVEDGSLEITVGEASLTVDYSSAAINGNVITLGGAPANVAANLGSFTSETTAADVNPEAGEFVFVDSDSDPVLSISDLSDAPADAEFPGSGIRVIRFRFASNAAANSFVSTLSQGNTTAPTGFNWLSLATGTVVASSIQFPLTMTNGANTFTMMVGAVYPHGTNSTLFDFTAQTSPDEFSSADFSGSGSYTAADGASWTFTSTAPGFNNLTVTDGVGEWFAPGTARVCLNGSGGDLTVGGDSMTGGDGTVMGDFCIEGDLKVEGGITSTSGTTTVTGDLDVTGTVDGVLIGSIRNINPVAGTGGIAQNFQIWAGTQSEFDAQFSNDGSGSDPGTTPAATDGSVVYIITNN